MKDALKAKASSLKIKPCLAIVLVGQNPASLVYVSGKEKACKEVGFECRRINMPESVSETELLNVIEELNNDRNVNGILVQLPLPKHIDEELVIDMVRPDKDVDGFSPVNMGALFVGKSVFIPGTPKGVVKLIESTNLPLEGKHAVVIGRSNIVGKPVAALLLEKNCTVTICHSKTRNLQDYTLQADILVAAIGKANMIKGHMIKHGAIVIDVGITRMPDGSLAGDVDFESASKVAGFITPVPGGVGPMTIACVLENTMLAYERQHST
jgi:methylenetetrahydrofolate dehydrogenase (NADP+)/methenyltetrahydrofolate cyclohydrolase